MEYNSKYGIRRQAQTVITTRLYYIKCKLKKFFRKKVEKKDLANFYT